MNYVIEMYREWNFSVWLAPSSMKWPRPRKPHKVSIVSVSWKRMILQPRMLLLVFKSVFSKCSCLWFFLDYCSLNVQDKNLSKSWMTSMTDSMKQAVLQLPRYSIKPHFDGAEWSPFKQCNKCAYRYTLFIRCISGLYSFHALLIGSKYNPASLAAPS